MIWFNFILIYRLWFRDLSQVGTYSSGLVYSECPRSSDPFYIVAYYITGVTTSWTDGTSKLHLHHVFEGKPCKDCLSGHIFNMATLLFMMFSFIYKYVFSVLAEYLSLYERRCHCPQLFTYQQVQYCMSKKFWPILYDKILHEMGQDMLDRQYLTFQSLI